jgi:curli biogenesis system outer membrane secretion channel CsgG
MKKKILTSLTGLLILTGCISFHDVPPLPKGAVPPRIAVSTFENRSSFNGQWKLGPGIADLLVSELVKSKNFVVLERNNLSAVVDEIALQKNRLFRQEGKIREGRLENAQYLIRGVITDFSQVSGGSLWMGFRHLFIGSGGYTARVSLTLTIIDIESGKIVDSVQCSGEARAGEVYSKGAYKDVRFGGNKFFKTPLGNATAKAIRQGLHGIVKKVPKHYWKPMIADITPHQIILNGGKNRKFAIDQFYRVRQKGHAVTDPGTGDVLEILPGPVIGVIHVTEVRGKVAGAEVVSGYGFKRGQLLERIKPPQPKPVEMPDTLKLPAK